MLKPLQMQKLRIIGLKSVEDGVLRILQGMGAVQIVRAKIPGIGEGKPLPKLDEISPELVRIRGILNKLDRVCVIPSKNKIQDAMAEAAKIRIDEELLHLTTEESRLSGLISALSQEKKEVQRLANVDIDFSKLPGNLEYLLVSVPQKELAMFEGNLGRNVKHYEIQSWDDLQNPQNKILLIAYTGGQKEQLMSGNAVELAMPKREGIPKILAQKIEFEMADLNEKLRRARARIEKMSREYYPICAAIEEELSIIADRAEIASKFSESSECFYLECWAKQRDVEGIKRKLRSEFGSRVLVQQLKKGKHALEDEPTVLENPKVAKPFQALVEMLSLPKPDEIDPTLPIMVFLPIIYGMIVGDAAYAFISLFLALGLLKISSKGGMLEPFAKIWAYGAIPTLIFGILYDEYFGFSHTVLLGLDEPLYQPLVHRVGDVQLLLLLSIGAGLIHLGVGFILGFINEYKHNIWHAMAKLGWLAVEIGGVIAIAGFMFGAVSQEIAQYGLGLLIIGLIPIVKAEGIVGIIEIPGLVSNVMSYARITAVGIAAVILAEVINEMMLPNPKELGTMEGAVMFVLVGILYLLLHTMNSFVAMFESLIHAARLNVVEFYGKFFHGNGIRFVPFVAKRRYTAYEGKKVM